jgi:hypothetical protein
LMSVTGLVQNLPQREGGDRWQAIGGRAEGFPQESERPSCGAIRFGSRSAADFAEDSSSFRWAIAAWLATAVTGMESGEPFGIEAGDEVGNGIAAPASDGASRVLEGPTLVDRQEQNGADDGGGGGRRRALVALEFGNLVGGEVAERSFRSTTHKTSGQLGRVNLSSWTNMATHNATDPLVSFAPI